VRKIIAQVCLLVPECCECQNIIVVARYVEARIQSLYCGDTQVEELTKRVKVVEKFGKYGNVVEG